MGFPLEKAPAADALAPRKPLLASAPKVA